VKKIGEAARDKQAVRVEPAAGCQSTAVCGTVVTRP